MRVFIAGANGQLGSELADIARVLGHDVTATDVDECNLLDPQSIAENLDNSKPDVVVNCAAWTKVDAAESEHAAAHALNAVAPENLAQACHQRSIGLIHISTDYVFDGTATDPMDETYPTNPLSVYGTTKLAGEVAVRREHPKAQIVRTAWLYGRQGPNFVLTMLRLAREGKPLRVVGDQYGSPTWTGHLAPALLTLAERGTPGLYHLTNSGQTSWAGFAQAIVECAGLDVPVTAITTAEYPTPAPRPAYSVLHNRAWRQLGEALLPDWHDGLAAYMASMSAQVAP